LPKNNYVFCYRERKLPTFYQHVSVRKSVVVRFVVGLVYFPKHASTLLQQRFHLWKVVGLGELESPTSPLSGVRSSSFVFSQYKELSIHQLVYNQYGLEIFEHYIYTPIPPMVLLPEKVIGIALWDSRCTHHFAMWNCFYLGVLPMRVSARFCFLFLLLRS